MNALFLNKVCHVTTQSKRFKSNHATCFFAAINKSARRSLHACSKMGCNVLSNNFNPHLKDRFGLLTNEDFRSYTDEYHHVVQDLVSLQGFENMSETNDWIKQVINYNVPHGKLIRPILLLAVTKRAQEMIGNDLPNVNRIAWAYEFFQGYATIHDDMMDKSQTRRDRPCWYLVDNVGDAAINDGDLLQNAAYILFRIYAKGKYHLYTDIVDTLHETFYKALYGQSLDNQVSRQQQFSRFRPDIYNKMMQFKNGYYTFYAPITIGLMLNGVNNLALFQKIKCISLEMGLLYSIQDDYIDCYVKPVKSGKIGTDIQDGKLSWLIVTALAHCSTEQRQILLKNYGLTDNQNIASIKEVYEELSICEKFRIWEKNAISKILYKIEKLPKIAPQKILNKIVHLLNGRTR